MGTVSADQKICYVVCNEGQYAFNNVCETCPTGQFMNTTGHVFKPYVFAFDGECSGGSEQRMSDCSSDCNGNIECCESECYEKCQESYPSYKVFLYVKIYVGVNHLHWIIHPVTNILVHINDTTSQTTKNVIVVQHV